MDLRTAELDVSSQESADRAVQQVLREAGRLDIVIHNAGHMVYGPAEAFTPEQLAELYDINVVSTQRVNRAALPVLRKQGQGLVIWVSSSTRGGTPPYLAPYFAAKAGMDAMAVSYALELARWNIETTIVVPGAYTAGTNHFARSGRPADESRANEYSAGPTATLAQEIMDGFAKTAVPDADVVEVADAIVRVVNSPFGSGRSVSISILPTMARRWSMVWPTEFAANYSATWALLTCSSHPACASLTTTFEPYCWSIQV